MNLRKFLLITLLLFAGIAVHGQSSALASRYLDTAVTYQRTVKNYTKALKYFELAISAGNHGNYTYYNAAQCACQCGQTEKAIDYYKKGFANFIDFYNYEFFATDSLNHCFSETPEWKQYLAYMKPKYDSVNNARKSYLVTINDTLLRINHSSLSDSVTLARQLSRKNTGELIRWIKNYNSYPTPPAKGQGTTYLIKVSDSLQAPFFVYVPKNYNPAKRQALYVFLHGGVSQRPKFYSTPLMYPDDKTILQRAMREEAVILYPLARKGFNWLLYQEALETIIREIAFVKSLYNIDDNRVYVAGHSDGGTATFWLATHKPGSFAGLLGFNYNPMAYFGNTSLGNLRNDVHWYGLSGSEDNTFPIQRVSAFRNYGLKHGTHWPAKTLKAGHGLPYDEPDTVQFAYDTLFSKIREPFPKHIQWETDEVKNGRYAWLSITGLDTLQERAPWYQELNPPPVIIKEKTIQYNLNQHKAAAVVADIHENEIHIRQSRVKQLTLYISPEMIDVHKPLSVYVDDKRVYYALVKPEKNDILEEFMKTKDRKIIIIKKIVLDM